MTVSPSVAPHRTTIRPVPKPVRRPVVGGLAAYRLAQAQGEAFKDIAADLEASDALDTARTIDRRRDSHVRRALRLVRLARQDKANAIAYLATADGHLREAIRLDRITDEHGQRAVLQVGASIEAGRVVIAVQEELLTGREEH